MVHSTTYIYHWAVCILASLNNFGRIICKFPKNRDSEDDFLYFFFHYWHNLFSRLYTFVKAAWKASHSHRAIVSSLTLASHLEKFAPHEQARLRFGAAKSIQSRYLLRYVREPIKLKRRSRRQCNDRPFKKLNHLANYGLKPFMGIWFVYAAHKQQHNNVIAASITKICRLIQKMLDYS